LSALSPLRPGVPALPTTLPATLQFPTSVSCERIQLNAIHVKSELSGSAFDLLSTQRLSCAEKDRFFVCMLNVSLFFLCLCFFGSIRGTDEHFAAQ
jgi:hypothetical protein